jgi:hypothetical protein
VTIVSHFFWSWYLFRKRPWVWSFACAAIAPDVPYCLLLAYYSVRLHVNGLADLTAWDLAWRSPIVRAAHAYVPWAATVLAVTAIAGRTSAHRLLPIWAGWLSHIVVDMLTHRSDGYPIFYPFATYRFPTPVSYWEPAYHGRTFALVDMALMLLLSLQLLLGRVIRRRAVKA